MKKFQRSPSKVWWAEEALNWSQRSTSSSSGSQDSGFSDAEVSPSNQKHEGFKSEENSKDGVRERHFTKDILKDASSGDVNVQNLCSNFREKTSPQKSSPFYSKKEKSRHRFPSISEGDDSSWITSPETFKKRTGAAGAVNTKVNRSLFSNLGAKQAARDQNVKEDNDSYECQRPCDNNNRTVREYGISSQLSASSLTEADAFETYPFPSESSYVLQKNNSAPAVLCYTRDDDNGEVTISSRKNSYSGSDESELESLFADSLDSPPKHTSTPKTRFRKQSMRQKRVRYLLQKYQNERTIRRRTRFENENGSVKKWLEEVREIYDSECMITLQCKSVAGDLAQKVSHIANMLTCPLRKALYLGEIIEKEFENVKSQNAYSPPLAQSLTGLVAEFARDFMEGHNDLLLKCEEVRRSQLEALPALINKLYINWSSTFHEILVKYLKKLVCYLEDPRSEIELRATLTAITSLTLRNESFASILTACDTVSTLCVLCEKCEGSTVRALILRALSTICCNTSAIREFEKASGIQIITDILNEDTRPEPERSEALALLAQTTAPWIENNRCLKTLQHHVKQLVKAITHFLTTTRCCQNLLLCAAALANLSGLEAKSIKYMLNQNTISYLLESIKERGSEVSVYLLEQTAIIFSNLSSMEEAREQMVEQNVVRVLLYFLQVDSNDKYAAQRIQQKAIVALSRLGGNKKAARQMVELRGISKLVNLCRDKDKRYDSDAVLVAALATLRKVAEICGTAAIDDEDIQELVQPRLLDSFLTYSTQNESYV